MTIKLLNVFEEVALVGEGERKLKALNKVLSESKTSNKNTNSSGVWDFTHGAGAKSDIKFEAMLAYWLPR